MDEREAIALRSQERILRDHKIKKRFADLFDTVELQK